MCLHMYIRSLVWHGHSYFLHTLHSWIRTETTSKQPLNPLSNLGMRLLFISYIQEKEKSSYTKFFLSHTWQYWCGISFPYGTLVDPLISADCLHSAEATPTWTIKWLISSMEKASTYLDHPWKDVTSSGIFLLDAGSSLNPDF